jgi:hypothetical protein
MLQHRLDSLVAVKARQGQLRVFREWRRGARAALARRTKQAALARQLAGSALRLLTGSRPAARPGLLLRALRALEHNSKSRAFLQLK